MERGKARELMRSILLMNTSRKGFVNSRYALLGLVALIVVGASVFATVSEAFAQEPTARNFFGTIVLIDNSVVRINTRDGVDLEVAVNDDTAVILPLNTDANITDLFEGDVVAVSLAEGDSPLVAEKIFVVSTQTKHKHIPADVIERTDSHITVDPINEKDRSLTFNITDKTRVVFRGGASSLDAGSFVVVIAVRDSNTGDLSPDAIEIHVSPVRTTSRPVETPENLVNRARIRGVFQEINEEDNWIIVAGTRVLVNTGC
jgi:hypothetical protein